MLVGLSYLFELGCLSNINNALCDRGRLMLCLCAMFCLKLSPIPSIFHVIFKVKQESIKLNVFI